MIVHDLVGTESNQTYQNLEIANVSRQYSFLQSMVGVSLELGRPFLSTTVIKAFNFHAITCLHTHAGEFRPCQVYVGKHEPPPHYRVQTLMEDFVNTVNRSWSDLDPVAIAAYVLWRLNYIHPFINGNGRTARATCYYVLCLKAGGLLKGTLMLPELLSQNRDRYVKALVSADASYAKGLLDLNELHALIEELIEQQLASASVNSSASDQDISIAPASLGSEQGKDPNP